MASEEPYKIVLSASELERAGPEMTVKWKAIEAYADRLEKKSTTLEADLAAARTNEDRLRAQLAEANHRERVLIHRLANKDHEIHEIMAQTAELKVAQTPGSSALRSTLLDPAVNLVVARLRTEVVAHKTRLEETQGELSAWKFTPDSNTGKRLMAKCRVLYQENEELGRVVSSGRLAKLEGDLALQKQFSEEVKKSQSELDEFLQDLDEDVEGMQGTIYFLQQELRKANERTGPDKGIVSNGISENSQCVAMEDDRTLNDNDLDPSPVKKARRISELSLDYNEDGIGLTNGERDTS